MFRLITKSVSNRARTQSIRSLSTKTPGTKVYIWGTGDDGQLGQPSLNKTGFLSESYKETSPITVPVMNNVGISHVSCGFTHTAITTSEGRLYTCGKNVALGHSAGDSGMSLEPMEVEGLEGVRIVEAVCGEQHTAALSEDGDIYTWGYGGGGFFGNAGALGTGDTTNQARPQKLIVGDGEVKFQSIDSGKNHMIALGNSGEVWTWGNGEFGRLGNNSNEDQLEPLPVDLILELELNITKIAAGNSFCLALTDEGQVLVWGKNDKGQLGLGGGFSMDVYAMETYPTPLTALENEKIVDIGAGEGHACAVTDKGQVYMWGQSTWMEPHHLSTLEQQNIVSVACGGGFSAAISDVGDLFTWGKGMSMRNAGVLGHGDKKTHLHPEKVQGITEPVQFVSCGNRHAAAINGMPSLK